MFRRPLPFVVLAAFVLVVQPLASSRRVVTDLELTIGSGNYQFRVNDVPKFLVFVSYFDALDQSGSNVNTDLAYLASNGVDGIRIMVNWWDAELDQNNYPDPPYEYDTDTLCDANGDLRTGTLSTLLGLLDDAKQEGLVVDLTITGETVTGLTLAEYTACIQDLTQELADGGSAYKHVLFDLQNEYDNEDTGPSDAMPLTDSQVASIVSAVKTIDSSRIVTASLSSEVAAGDADGRADNEDLDVVAWHEERFDGYWDYTATWVAALDDVGLPVYLQEPARRNPDQNNLSWTIADNWAENVYNAKNANADAWTLHTGASFELGSWTLQSVLHQEEKDFLQCLGEGDVFANGTCSPDRAPVPELTPQRLVGALLSRWWSKPAPRAGART